MNEEKIRQIIRDEIDRSGNRDTYSVAQVPRHIHNGVDAPFAFTPSVTFAGFVLSTGIPTTPFPKGWLVHHGVFNLVFTGTLKGAGALTLTAGVLAGATTATLNASWTFSSGIEEVTFSNGDVRSVTFTHGSAAISWAGGISIGGATSAITTAGATSGTLATAWSDPLITAPILVTITFSNGDVDFANVTFGSTTVTWSTGLTSNATALASTVATGLYLIEHNLDSVFYAAAGNAVAFNTFNVIEFEINPDVLNVEIFDSASQDPIDSSFCFLLTVVNNKDFTPPPYNPA